MDFLTLCQNRFSLRDYAIRTVEREKIEYILEAARLAPSAVNFQPWTFLVITEGEGRQKIQESYPRDWFKNAPVYILVCANHEQAWTRKCDGANFAAVDASIAIEHMTLAATAIGLGSCWVCNFDPTTLRQNFMLPDHIEPIAILPIGYPADENTLPTKSRKPLAEIVKWEKF